MRVPLDIIVLTTVVVTVLITLHATNRLVIVTEDVTRDTPKVTAAKVNLQIDVHTPLRNVSVICLIFEMHRYII